MRLRKYNKFLGMFSLFTATLLLSGCDMALMNPKGQIGLEQRSLILTALGLMLIVVIPVIIMAIVFARKYRASNDQAKYTPHWSHSNKVEAVVWTVPIIIIVILAAITWKTTHELDPYKPLDSDVKPINVEVVSLDWKWLFIYPDLGIASVNELAFPANVPVSFKITSNSVMNSLFIPRLGGQIYAMAGMQTKLHLIANEPGKYDGISGAYSGKGFSGMKFTAIATPNQQAFDQWVNTVRQSSHTLSNMGEFEKLALPSEYHPVEYFSQVQPDLFRQVITKFTGNEMYMQHHAESAPKDEGMQSHEGMDMSEHSSH
ncbi:MULTISPECIES: cytochrome o ubiquinol oxidase subunit II [Lonsdalea]|uniref:Cytochrome ubiquinol oxidase subunit II n=2 Tax=Lonsdalea TaxID=1082702 RepID=A0ACD1JCR8_9GAMM|nr:MULTISPECIES: cytochrome o ubiquinol oxidase subunit II [Lonsdalea]OSM99139.1 cytochrome ubiquinol oxidase subunit II [Lonsdalea populi]QPQ25106.1 cytochrome o ubiquinol oxidase subunit II [Lonsdalea populi]RAT13603.1 cytochrome ubiquinol oxidase subunit II [Lonsdalea quercina]RAT17591.1 cytochrome ubiquinol oxidase subunit II [Lonsdalea quercina]RAT20054.1 cytochrome ubiquinol oxidase subunit II [Lonsdalea populi]